MVLVTGGSQGAQELNEVLLKSLPELLAEAGIIHITGERNFTAVSTVASEVLEASTHKAKYKVFPYLADTMRQAVAAADVVVTRAGATTLAELMHMQKPALIIPLDSSAGDHQRKNAAVLERAGAARVLDPANLGKNLFLQNVRSLLADEGLRRSLAEGMEQLDRPQAAADVAKLAFSLAMGLAPRRGTAMPAA